MQFSIISGHTVLVVIMESYKKIGLSHEMGLIDTPPLKEIYEGVYL